MALRGRTPGLELARGGGRVGLTDWSLEICARMQPLAELLDAREDTTVYRDALARQVAALNAPELLPSAQVLAAIKAAQVEFHTYTRELSLAHRRYFLERPPSAELTAEFEALATASHAEQARLEAEQGESFEAYLARYVAA